MRVFWRNGMEHGLLLADLAHYQGKAKYKGMGKLVGVGESLFRLCLPFELSPDRLSNDGESIDVWGGLEVISFPDTTSWALRLLFY